MPWSVWVKLWWSSSTRGFWDFALKVCLKEGLEASSISCVVKMSYDSNEISGNVLHSSRSICFPKWFEYSNKIVVCLLSCHYIRICSKQTRNLVLLGNFQKKGNFWQRTGFQGDLGLRLAPLGKQLTLSGEDCLIEDKFRIRSWFWIRLGLDAQYSKSFFPSIFRFLPRDFWSW